MTTEIKQSWLDDAGDLFEQEGFHPGRIFEFHENLASHCLEDGGVAVTKDHIPPGTPPHSLLDIQWVRLKESKTGEIHKMDPKTPLFLNNFHKIKVWC